MRNLVEQSGLGKQEEQGMEIDMPLDFDKELAEI